MIFNHKYFHNEKNRNAFASIIYFMVSLPSLHGMVMMDIVYIDIDLHKLAKSLLRYEIDNWKIT